MVAAVSASIAPLLPAGMAPLFAADFTSAALASLLVTPLVAAVDKAIVQLASGSTPSVGASVVASLASMAKSPLSFARRPEFMLVFVVYFLTYLAANTMSTFCQATGHSEEIPKLISTTVTNVVSCITKDAMLAKIYGTGSGAIPLVTILLFTARDMMTIASSFTAPPKVSKYLQKSHDLPPSVADNVAQLVCPVAVQVVSTPIHLLGLGLYNNPTASVNERVASVASTYHSALNGRMGRILPAFGIGGVSNRIIRQRLRNLSKHDSSTKKKKMK